MKNPKRKSIQFRESITCLSIILGLFTAAAVVTSDANKADAGVPTADSKAWTNDGLTGEIGLDYRTFDASRSRKVIIPAVVEHGRIVTPSRTINVPFTQRINNTSGSGKISGRPFGSDVLIGIGYGGKLFGYTAVKNGNLVGTVGATAFSSDRPQMFGSIAYSPIKNTAVFADARQGQISYGLQQQLGDTYLYGAYSPKTNGYAFGIGLEIGGNAPVAKTPTCLATYDLRDGGCIKKIATPVRQINTVIPLPPAPPKGEFGIRGRG